MHKPAQVEMQLDWSQLPYLEYSNLLLQKVAQPNAQYKKKGPLQPLTQMHIANFNQKQSLIVAWIKTYQLSLIQA